MRQQSAVATWCERAIEAGWLLALLLIPTYFNLLSSRHFEPDKATTLRSIVLAMTAAALIYAVERLVVRPRGQASDEPPDANGPPHWRRLLDTPLALATLLYAAVYLLATAVSVVPLTSFWGSYQRLQGTYTNLSYIGLGVLVALFLRRRAQLDRLVAVMVLASLIPACYGIVQSQQVDPLPWRGDVVARVASTMGNSIFVAAYMIMVVPYALYLGVVAAGRARAADAPLADRPLVDLGWAAAWLLLVLAALLLVFGAMMFGAVVRTADLRYWWVYPGALIAAGGMFLAPTLGMRARRITPVTLAPALTLVGYVVAVGIAFALGQGDGQRVVPLAGRPGVEWPLVFGAAVVLTAAGYLLLLLLPRREGAPSRLTLGLHAAGAFGAAALLLVATFLTQSRGPWLGAGAGLFAFITLLLLIARRRAAGTPRARLWRNLLIAESLLTLALGIFLIAFNLSDAPVFAQLREVPYIGRMGRLLEVDEGTGKVRRLIWVGDEQAGGAVALITSDPLRAVVGWGPESMFVVYNRFYPPSLTSVEARTASPDRSHQAYLDELITRGVLGLASYLFVLISFAALAWRLLTRLDSWPAQVLVIAAASAVTAHAVEGLTGIPIVSTLMLLWLSLAVTVAVGALEGQYRLPGQAPAPVSPAPAAESAAPVSPAPAGRAAGQKRSSRKRPQTVARGAAGAHAPAPQSSRGAAPLLYAVVGVLAVGAIWAFNVDNVFADMRFQQGQGYTEDPRAGLEQQIVGTAYLIDAVRMEPNQDFYYLSLGRSLMQIVAIEAEAARQSGAPLGTPDAGASVAELLRLADAPDVQEFVLQRTPIEILSYARAVLLRAYELNPLNKDHSANLARLYNFWYGSLTGRTDPQLLEQAVEWFSIAHQIAPQDVGILNEYAGAVASSGDYTTAAELLAQSRRIDARYVDTLVRLAELERLQGRYPEAVEQYLAILDRDIHALDGSITTIAMTLADTPELLLRLRDRYAAELEARPDDVRLASVVGLLSDRAGDLAGAADAFGQVVALQPDNLEARRNYTLVLSDLLRYDEAAAEADQLLALARRQQLSPQDQDAFAALLAYLQARAGE